MTIKNPTADFINKYISLYTRICRLNENDIVELLRIKKDYSNFIKKCKETHHFYIKNSIDRDKYLSNNRMTNFKNSHIKFEKIVFQDGSDSRIYMSGDNWSDYLFDRMWLERTNIAKTYDDYVLFEDHTKINPEVIFFKNLPKDYISILKRRLKKKKSELQKHKKLLKKEVNIIKLSILPYLEEYQIWAENYFFDIRKYLKYYSKRVKIQISAKKFFLVYIFKNKNLELKINDIIPAVDASIESLMQKDGFHFLTYIHDYTNKSNYLHITEEGIFFEVLELFFDIANKNEINKFFEKVFILLGYQAKLVEDDLFLINKMTYMIDDYNPVQNKSESHYFLLNYTHLYDVELKNALKKINTLRKKYNFNNDLYLYTFSDSSLQEVDLKIKNSNIIKIGNRNLFNLLFKTEHIHFTIDFVQNIILTKKSSRINALLVRKQIGKQLITEISKIQSGHKNFKKFEILVNRIFEYLFKDSFRQYFAEPHSVDYEGHQIRDLIISNISPIKEFWKERKKEQNAKQIIVDSKNYTNSITKREINSIAQYLNKNYGNFGIVVSRKESDNSAKKEQKIKFADNKLIIHLSENDLISLILHKINNQEVEDLLERKIHEIIK